MIICWLIVAFLLLTCLITVREGLSLSDMNETPPKTEEEVEAAAAAPAAPAPPKAPGSSDCPQYENVIRDAQKKNWGNQYADFRYCKSSDNQYCLGLPNPVNQTLPCPLGYKQVNINDMSEPVPKKGLF